MKLQPRDLLLRIVLPAAVSVIILAAGVFGWLLPEFEKHVLELHRNAVHDQTDAAWSLIARLNERVEAGDMTLAQAQQRAADALRHTRYGEDGEGYFWVHDIEGRILVHPYRPDLEGANQWDLRDDDGNNILRTSIATAREGGGFITYSWQKQGRTAIIAPKLTFVRPFEPWGWVIATGVYLDDVQAEIDQMTARASWIVLAIFIAAGLMLGSLVWRAIRVERRRQEAEAAREDSEAKYRMIVEHQQDMVIKVDRDGRFMYVSPSFTEIFGVSEDEAIGQNFLPLVTEEDRSVAERAFRTVQSAPYVAYSEQRVKTVEGVRWYGWRNRAALDEDGNVEAIICVGRDITGRRTAELAVRDSEERLRSLVRVAPMGIGVMRHRMLHDANDSLCRMLGYERDDVVGQSARMFYHSDEAFNEVGAAYKRQLRKSDTSSVETQWVRKDGTSIDVLVSYTTASEDGDLDHVIFTAVDITERKSLEAQLRQSQKMEAIGQLAGGVAHDFNNQLTIIRGYCDLMHDDDGIDQDIRDQLKHIDAAAARAGRLTSQLLAFSRKQVLRPAVIDLAAIADEMHRPLARMVGEDVRITVACNASPATCKLDRSQLEQAIINLAINARDAMLRGGTLAIEVDHATFEQDTPGDLPPGRYVRLSLIDDGTGMDEQTRLHLFEPFFTTKDVGKGTGLGLSMVYGFVTQSNGTIVVDSELGRGTTFRLYFPAVAEAAEDVADKPVFDATGGRESILIVEDEPAVRKLIARVLGDLGYNVHETASTDDALAVGTDLDTHLDMLVADVVMPGYSGPQLAAQIRQARPDIGVLYVSGYVRGVAVRRGLIDPTANILSKPFGPRELAVAVREVLDLVARRTARSPAT